MATGISVSKANAYAVISTPVGISVSKANAYAVISYPATGIDVTKAVVYAVLSASSSFNPAWARPQPTIIGGGLGVS